MPSGMYLPHPKKGGKLHPIAYVQQNPIKNADFPAIENINKQFIHQRPHHQIVAQILDKGFNPLILISFEWEPEQDQSVRITCKE